MFLVVHWAIPFYLSEVPVLTTWVTSTVKQLYNATHRYTAIECDMHTMPDPKREYDQLTKIKKKAKKILYICIWPLKDQGQLTSTLTLSHF